MKELMDRWGISSQLLHVLLEWGMRIVGVLVLLAIAFVIARAVQNLVRTRLEHSKFDKTLARLLGSLVRWLILVSAFVGSLGVFGVQTTSFAAVLGGAALAVGLAIQGTLSNVAAGSMLLVFRPFRVDDTVIIEGVTGTVYELGLFTTTLDTAAGHRVVIPNNKVFGNTIENITIRKKRRLELPLRVSYDADIDQTRHALLNAVAGLDHQLAPAQAFLSEFGETAVIWRLRVYCRPEHYGALQEASLRAVKHTLEEAHIELAYPHIVLKSPPANHRDPQHDKPA